MNCLKCGDKTEGNQVFCPKCLERLEKYPVDPNIPIYLPHNKPGSASKKPVHRKRTIPPEEQILRLRAHIRRLVVTTVVLSLLFVLASGALTWMLLRPQNKIPTGQNYRTSATGPVTAYTEP